MQNKFFSSVEARDIVISVFVLALAFASYNLAALPITLFIITAVFLSHELAHRTIARRYGCFAEYRMWPFGLMLALVSSLFGFIFAAPGAVYISPYVRRRFAFTVARFGKREYGLIALSGPATNIIMGAVFLLAASATLPDFFAYILALASRISFFLALFNLLPFAPLDGEKVFSWNKAVWLGAIAAAAAGWMFL